MREINRVAVLGAGTMGSRIAAHFANAGVPTLLLDIVSPGQPDRNAAARRGIENALRQKPGGFFTEAAARLVTPGNFDDDLDKVRGCDWIIEAVVEDLEIKRRLLLRVGAAASPDSVVSTNTSGLRLAGISEGFPHDFRRRFLGVHFFNPPRYLHLVEIIPGEDTDPEVLAAVSDFCDRRLGKGVVLCKDTPNFIANRIGSFFVGTACRIMIEQGYSIEEVDALTGPLIGLPNSATFRLLDIIGLDLWSSMGRNLFEAVPGDAWRERFLPPACQLALVERGWLGEKSGQGFYKRVGKGAEREIHVIDWTTLEYHPAAKAGFPTADAARKIPDLPARLRALVASDDRAGSFLWRLFADLLAYSAGRVPEISDRIVEIDRAMRWGYAHGLGPFELWDALGVEETARRMEREGRALPASVQAMLSSGAKSFYRPADSGGKPRTEYFDLRGAAYSLIEERPGVVELGPVKRARGVVKTNRGASLVDLGDGVLCVEFHSRMNTLGEDQFAMLRVGLEETARNFRAMLIANQGDAFSAGADQAPILALAQAGKWEELDALIRGVQEVFLALKYAVRPVVSAPFARTLGAGCEVVLHSARAQASAELSMGFQDAAAGLIPFGGAARELLLRLGDAGKALDLILSGRVSSSAADARELGLLSPGDGLSMNPERLIGDAKELALSLADNYLPPAPRDNIIVPGDGGEALLAVRREAKDVSPVAEKLAYVLSGGRLARPQAVSERYLGDLEREAFLSLSKSAK